MGYHTDFDGEFRCWRADSPEMAVFLKAIYRDDHGALGVFADWLLDRDDPLGPAIAEARDSSKPYDAAFWPYFGLAVEHSAYLRAFSSTRRMKRDAAKAELLPDPMRVAVGLPVGVEGGYFVGWGGLSGQDRDESVLDYNSPPDGQPGLWCNWAPRHDYTALVWSGAEKFYDYVEWLEYLIVHFLKPWGYVLNGEVEWWGENREDRGTIYVDDNRVDAVPQPEKKRRRR